MSGSVELISIHLQHISSFAKVALCTRLYSLQIERKLVNRTEASNSFDLLVVIIWSFFPYHVVRAGNCRISSGAEKKLSQKTGLVVSN